MADAIDSEAGEQVEEAAEGPGGIANPRSHADKRKATGGASSMFTGGKSAEEKKSRKWSIIGAVIGVIGIVIVLLLHSRSQAQSAATTTTGTVPTSATDAATQGDVLGYGGGSDAGLQSQIQQISNQLASLQNTASAGSTNPTGGTTSTTTGGTSATQTQAKGATNPYPVGMKVTSSESIVQSLYDAPLGAYIDLTSQGGLYTGPGANVKGSAYNPALQGQALREQIGAGNTIQVYGAKGLLGTYQLSK
jgi:hypothetical protein